jgi:hypothetical protein
MLGSSANVTREGQKVRVKAIEDEIKEVADLIVDYSLQRCHTRGHASINFYFGNMKVLGRGSCYELFRDRERLAMFWGIELSRILSRT